MYKCVWQYVCIFTVPPVIRAVRSHYTAIIGSQITLVCSIIEWGVPPAEFGWRKDGIEINIDNVTVITNRSAIALIIRNLTISDVGTYICEAASEQSYLNDQTELRIKTFTTFIEGLYI